jgi:hypothetical protein
MHGSGTKFEYVYNVFTHNVYKYIYIYIYTFNISYFMFLTLDFWVKKKIFSIITFIGLVE